MLEDVGATNVRTYIQSGNTVFELKKADAKLAERIGERIEKRHGFQPAVMLLAAKDFRRAMAANPFSEAESEPKTLHLYFLAARPAAAKRKAVSAALEGVRRPTERFQLTGKVLYLHTPDGLAGSKLPARLEKELGTAATGRNWRTVAKIWELVA